MRSSWPRSSSSVVSSVQARGGSLSSVSARKRSTPLPRPAAVSKRKIASMHFEPARVAWRGALRSGSVRKPLARASGASSPSCAAIAGAALTVRMRPLKASTSRQWPSARKSAASAASSPEPRTCSKRASQWLAIAASVSEPACMRLTSYTIAVQNRQRETGRLGAAEDRSPGGGVAAAAAAAALGALHGAGAGRGGDRGEHLSAARLHHAQRRRVRRAGQGRPPR